MRKPSVYVVVLNWNQKDLTDECLASLAKATYPAFRIVVVDNGSEDGSVEYLRQRHPGVTYIANRENLGFSGGNNVGIEHAMAEGCDYVYLLNNDTEVSPDFLYPVVSTMESDPKIGIAGSTVFYFNPPDIIWFTGAHANWLRGDMVDPRVGKRLDKESARLEDVDEVAGAGMMVRRKVIEHVGMLDSTFFIYFEETDWCQRAKKGDWRVVWVPESQIWHKVSMTFGEVSPVMTYLMTRNRWLFMRKHCPRFSFFALHYFLRGAKWYCRHLWGGQPVLAKAVLWGLRDALLSRYGKGAMEELRGKNA